MIEEIGKVESVDGEEIIVIVDKKKECDKCGMCVFPKGASKVQIRAQNHIGACVGDVVEIRQENDQRLLSAILVFLVPLLLIGLSTAITYLLKLNELFILIFVIGLLVIWFAILSFIDKKRTKNNKYLFITTKILKK